ncbi:MAG: HAMP domain-containing protein [Chromatiaceae bacterium]|nr:HAMP domain-containing protein [Gammaproteobacteria bacterium]MCP5305765.1 HAMP domain-containing protein [Chromatiaceae bacterium]MCP5312622.1 HAMP domain-containing protein [Chromatiaceae bacterium]
MNIIRQTDDRCPLPDAPRQTGFGGFVRRAWRRFDNSSIPLGLKWSMSIAALIVVTMGVLGFFLIQQQEEGYRNQVDRFSTVIVEQLLRVSGEPLMAADSLGLQILLQRHVQSELVLGAALHDADGNLVAEAGVSPPGVGTRHVKASNVQSWDWENGEYKAVSYVSPVVFQDVTAGYLTVSIDRSPLEADLQETSRFLMLSSVTMILIGIVLASLLAHRLSRPIERLARAGEVLGAGRPQGAAERRDEIGQVLETFQHLAEGVRRKHHAEAALSRYVSRQVAHQVLTANTGLGLGGSCVTGSVLFCDIVGFTELSEKREPGEVGSLLNGYFGYFALAAESCGGTVDNFIGDCIMIVFGAPNNDAHHALHALTCGMLIQQLTRRINQIREANQQPTVMLRVGISSGPMLAGNLGSVERMQYTVVGDTVNVAARLCGIAPPGGVLLPRAMMAPGHPGQREHYDDLGAAQLRGRREPVDVCAMDVEAVAKDVNADQLIDHILSSVTG